MKTKLLIFCILTLSIGAEARVFNINRETFASYFSVSGGSSMIAKSMAENESPASVTFNEGLKYNYSGEFGFLYSRPYASLRFGLEILKPQIFSSKASNTTDELYTAKSDLLGVIPKLTLEVNLHSAGTYRSFIAVGVGSGDVTLKNNYTFTTAGATAYPGLSEITEAKGSGTSMQASLGYEGLMTDTTTVVFELGYRQMKVSGMKYTKAATTFNGAKVSGDPVLDAAGEKGDLDLGGFLVTLGFRFYM